MNLDCTHLDFIQKLTDYSKRTSVDSGLIFDKMIKGLLFSYPHLSYKDKDSLERIIAQEHVIIHSPWDGETKRFLLEELFEIDHKKSAAEIMYKLENKE